MTRLLQYRFPQEESETTALAGHAFGNLLIAALSDIAGRLRGGRARVEPRPRRARPGRAGDADAADPPRRDGRRFGAGRPVDDHANARHPPRVGHARGLRGDQRRDRGHRLRRADRHRSRQPLHEPAAEPGRAGRRARHSLQHRRSESSSATSRPSRARPRATRSPSTSRRSTRTASAPSSTSSSPTTTARPSVRRTTARSRCASMCPDTGTPRLVIDDVVDDENAHRHDPHKLTTVLMRLHDETTTAVPAPAVVAQRLTGRQRRLRARRRPDADPIDQTRERDLASRRPGRGRAHRARRRSNRRAPAAEPPNAAGLGVAALGRARSPAVARLAVRLPVDDSAVRRSTGRPRPTTAALPTFAGASWPPAR